MIDDPACSQHAVTTVLDTGTQAVTESLCTSKPAQRSTSVSIPRPSLPVEVDTAETRVTMTLMSVKNHYGQGTAVILDRSH
jgi:hypothetical protein